MKEKMKSFINAWNKVAPNFIFWMLVLLLAIALVFGLGWWAAYYQMLPMAVLTPICLCVTLDKIFRKGEGEYIYPSPSGSH